MKEHPMTTTANRKIETRRDRPSAPGWPEFLAGAVVYAASYGLVVILLPLIEDDGVAGVVGLFVSGLMGLIALAAAVLVRIRGLAAFGFRRAKVRHLALGAALGLVAFVILSIASFAFSAAGGEVQNVQASYQAGAAAGVLSLVLTFVAGSIITPIGEEAFFRGVIANALLAKYGAWIGIIASAAIFALAHGFNPIMGRAFIVGVLAALLFRRTGSIWPGVMLHGVNNTTALMLPVIVAAATN
jgi:membrane protease YdiL (CAAX protease family)